MHAPEYVAARRVLLDALDALGPQRNAVVLVGAQAIYLGAGPGDVALAPYTTDGDLAINPDILADEPTLVTSMQAAGFSLAIRPGTWRLDNVQIDLLVPKEVAKNATARRSADLGAHGHDAARKAKGLEAALVDNSLVKLISLDPCDSRITEVAVAGLPALLVAKLHKIHEREPEPRRWIYKDGLDVLRILRATDMAQTGTTLNKLQDHAVAGLVTREARLHLEQLFTRRDGHGTQLTVRSMAGVEDEHTVAASCSALAQKLLDKWERS